MLRANLGKAYTSLMLEDHFFGSMLIVSSDAIGNKPLTWDYTRYTGKGAIWFGLVPLLSQKTFSSSFIS